MGGLLTTADLIIFFGSLLAIMLIGLWVGRKEDNTTDYYLAGKKARWWGVAGSIFGSNISANHIVGMMGVGFAVGFAESHFELGAIAGLLLLCYGFLPVYRKLNVFTLSEYLSRRYNDSCRVIYTVIMVVIIVVIMMVPGFYIGSRSLNILLLEDKEIDKVLKADVAGPGAAPKEENNIKIDRTSYIYGILLMAFVTGTYTIVGGLKAVMITDVIQSLLMIIAAIIVCILTFSQAEIGGWFGMLEMDAARGEAAKMHLYLPSDHPQRPWTGMLSGLMILHFYYWGTNQFIAQRALAAKSDEEARLGIITAGFFKLLIPFISIGTGVAAFYLFSTRYPQATFVGDTAFPMLMREVVKPIGFGLVGLVATGLVGAILSSLDSMMNSAATLITFDVYKKFINPEASERRLIWVGRFCIAGFVLIAAVLTIFIMDPNSKENFFTYVASHQSRLVAGIFVAFFVGMFWKRATPMGGLAALIAGVFFSYTIPFIYKGIAPSIPGLTTTFGKELNFFHTVFLSAILATLTHVIVSLCTEPDEEKSKLTWSGLGVMKQSTLFKALVLILLMLGVYAFLAVQVVNGSLLPMTAGVIGGLLTFGVIGLSALRRGGIAIDRLMAGLLAGLAIWMLFRFF